MILGLASVCSHASEAGCSLLLLTISGASRREAADKIFTTAASLRAPRYLFRYSGSTSVVLTCITHLALIQSVLLRQGSREHRVAMLTKFSRLLTFFSSLSSIWKCKGLQNLGIVPVKETERRGKNLKMGLTVQELVARNFTKPDYLYTLECIICFLIQTEIRIQIYEFGLTKIEYVQCVVLHT